MPSWLLEKKKREGERQKRENREGTRSETRSPESREENAETFSYYTGDALEMEQETGTCEKGGDE